MNIYAMSRVSKKIADDEDREAGAVRGFVCVGASRTQQHFKEECDINTIVKRFGISGVVPGAARMPEYGDFTAATDYQTALNSVLEAQAEFMKLPAHVRKAFDNDPQQLLEFVSDDANRAEAEKLGLVPAKPAAPSPTEGAPKEPTSGST